MEIDNFSSPIISPARSTSTVEDGDVGQKGSYYGRPRKLQKNNQNQHMDEIPPRLEGSSSYIDIHV
jgi:hypothetical protein